MIRWWLNYSRQDQTKARAVGMEDARMLTHDGWDPGTGLLLPRKLVPLSSCLNVGLAHASIVLQV